VGFGGEGSCSVSEAEGRFRILLLQVKVKKPGGKGYPRPHGVDQVNDISLVLEIITSAVDTKGSRLAARDQYHIKVVFAGQLAGECPRFVFKEAQQVLEQVKFILLDAQYIGHPEAIVNGLPGITVFAQFQVKHLQGAGCGGNQLFQGIPRNSGALYQGAKTYTISCSCQADHFRRQRDTVESQIPVYQIVGPPLTSHLHTRRTSMIIRVYLHIITCDDQLVKHFQGFCPILVVAYTRHQKSLVPQRIYPVYQVYGSPSHFAAVLENVPDQLPESDYFLIHGRCVTGTKIRNIQPFGASSVFMRNWSSTSANLGWPISSRS